jgi:hypothetical protein
VANIFTQAGEDLLTDIIGLTVSAPAAWYIGWGTGAGTAVKGSTTLFTEAAEARVSATLSQPTSDTNKFLAQLTAAAGKTITNAGVFSASTAGTLFIHSDFTGIVLAAGDKIEFDFQILWS